MEDFIGRLDCPEHVVDGIVKYFVDNKDLHVQGTTGVSRGNEPTLSGVNKDIKDSTDLVCYMPQLKGIWKDYQIHLSQALDKYAERFTKIRNLHNFSVIEPFLIQHYEKGGGYKMEHFERYGANDLTIKRVLVFMTYLNDVDDGGTHFKYYNHTEEAIKGKTIIWPADWTHTHCGQISQTKPKMIVTGWFSHLWDFYVEY
jgi:hypothetical protein